MHHKIFNRAHPLFALTEREKAALSRLAPTGTYQWLMGILKLDMNAKVRLRRGLALFANARNITDEQHVLAYHTECEKCGLARFPR